ncbi:MAG: helix-turn-helix domain-containing protein [Streptomycetales bacterium]
MSAEMSGAGFSQTLRHWRTRRGLSLRALACLAKCGKSNIWDLEHGSR